MQRKAPSATALGASLLHRTGCLAAGAAPQLAMAHGAVGSGQHHPLMLTNTWSWRSLQAKERTGLHLTPRATLLTARSCSWPRAQRETARAGGWQVPGTFVLLGGQEDRTQPQQPLLSVPELQLAHSSSAAQVSLISQCIVALPGLVSSQRLATAV